MGAPAGPKHIEVGVAVLVGSCRAEEAEDGLDVEGHQTLDSVWRLEMSEDVYNTSLLQVGTLKFASGTKGVSLAHRYYYHW